MSANGAGFWVDVDRSRRVAAGLPLEFGSTGPLWIRRERLEWPGLARPVSLLYASDLHLGGRWSRRVIAELLLAAERSSPDLIVLGGDLADSRRGLGYLESCVAQLCQVSPVWGLDGNHDRAVGVSCVRAAFESSGGNWLVDHRDEVIVESAGPVRLDGRLDLDSVHAGARVLCAHDPAVFPQAVRAGYRLVLAGHLHGSQFVLAERNGKLYPGAWFFRWNGLRFSECGCTMWVSRGMADTLPMRWNCPREVLLCQLG